MSTHASTSTFEQPKLTHLMLDLETMGNGQNAAIVAIAAVEFDIDSGRTGREFIEYVSLQSSLYLGLEVDESTIQWWLSQNDEARDSVFDPDRTVKPIEVALQKFYEFAVNMDYTVWGNSARFDCGILSNALRKARIPQPWDFRKERCLRTLASLNLELKKTHQGSVSGVKHNPLHDCYFQIGYCCKIWKSLQVVQ